MTRELWIVVLLAACAANVAAALWRGNPSPWVSWAGAAGTGGVAVWHVAALGA